LCSRGRAHQYLWACSTTRQFLEDFKANDARALKQQGLEVPLSFVLSEAAVENFDIEGVLDLLETP